MFEKKGTNEQFDVIVEECRSLFLKKYKDYGTAWRILRPTSLTDQIQIKARRIRNIQELQTQKIGDSIESEFVGIINYSIMALIQLSLPKDAPYELDSKTVTKLYDQEKQAARDLLIQKNHDYGEAWRDMRVSSITDLILMKLLRLRQIEDNQGQTIVSEGLDANYLDILIYSVFALILLREKKTN